MCVRVCMCVSTARCVHIGGRSGPWVAVSLAMTRLCSAGALKGCSLWGGVRWSHDPLFRSLQGSVHSSTSTNHSRRSWRHLANHSKVIIINVILIWTFFLVFQCLQFFIFLFLFIHFFRFFPLFSQFGSQLYPICSNHPYCC